MTLRHLLIQLGLAAGMMVVANVAVQCLAINSVPRQLLRTAERSEPATDLFLGNSTMAAGIDEASFARQRPLCRPLNLGLGASSPVEHYLIYRQQRKHANARVFYGFIDTQLTDPPTGDWNSLVGNRAMAYYVEPDVSRAFFTAESPMQDLLFRLYSHIPIAVERYAIWAKVEKLRRHAAQFGLPARITTPFGNADDFALQQLDTENFISRCEQALYENLPLNAPITSLFKRVRKSGNELYVVEMPMPTDHRSRYYAVPAWLAYRAHVKKLVTSFDGVYVEAAEWIQDDGFADALHMNRNGAMGFSYNLGKLVSSN